MSRESPILIMSLRSGAGIDGLQGMCRTVAYGELDWSSGVHGQCGGRVHRDGQKDGVTEFYLVTDDGSDPVVMDVLGVKKIQLAGIRDPDRDVIETATDGAENIKKLAQFVIDRRNGKPRESKPAQVIELRPPRVQSIAPAPPLIEQAVEQEEGEQGDDAAGANEAIETLRVEEPPVQVAAVLEMFPRSPERAVLVPVVARPVVVPKTAPASDPKKPRPVSKLVEMLRRMKKE
jgi:hypothetical protein